VGDFSPVARGRLDLAPAYPQNERSKILRQA